MLFDVSKDKILHKRSPFFPCDHDGPCNDNGCSCAKEKLHCEKSCGCPPNCERRFRGCKCARKGNKVCTRNCPCVLANRECDPDLCGQCGVIDILDPANRNERGAEWLSGKCQNCSVQRGIPKRTLIGTSTIHGFGLFVGEPIKSGDFIGEYKGELVTHQEGERRGVLDRHVNISYLFMVNESALRSYQLSG